MQHPASLDLVRQVRLVPTMNRAFWSVERAWPGATVRLHVEMRFVPDATPLAIEIRSADPAVETVVHTIDDATVEDDRCIVEHVIDWDDDALSTVLAATKVCSFYFVASIEKYGLTLTSTPLYVPFEPLHP